MFQDLRAYWSSYTGPTAQKGLISLLDQGIISGTNFVTGIVLGRLCSPEEFGAYVLAFGILMLAATLQASLITTPMIALGPAHVPERRRPYISSLLLMQTGMALSLCGVFVIVSATLRFSNSGSSGFLGALFGMGVAVFFVQLQEFFRRLLYSNLQVHRALANDTMYCLLQVLGLFALWRLGDGTWSPSSPGYLSAQNVFLWLAVSALLASLLGMYQSRGQLIRSGLALRKEIEKNWHFGRWLFASNLAYLAATTGFVYLLGALASSVEVSRFAAPRQIVAPVHLFLLGGAAFLGPVLSHRFSVGGFAYLRYTAKRAMIILVPVFVYCFVVFSFPGSFLFFFYEAKYVSHAVISQLVAVMYMVHSVSWFLGLSLTAARRPQALWYSNLLSAAVALLLGAPLVYVYGALGAALGLGLSAIAALVLTLRYYLRMQELESAANDAVYELSG